MSTHGPDGTPDRRPSVDDELRAALGGATERESFDHEALVAGTLRRAGRIRRRRAVSAAVAAAVVVPTLAGTGWILGNRLTGDPQGSVDVTIATQTETPTLAPAPDVVATDSPSATDDEASSEEPVEPPAATAVDPETTTPAPDEDSTEPAQETETAADEPSEDTQPEPSVEETAPVATPPWQASPPPAPLDRTPLNPDLPNRVDIPDARPVGIPFLDALGAPRDASLYPRTMALSDYMVSGEGSVEPHSGADWAYFEPTNSWEQDIVDIKITAWDDSAAALQDIRTAGGQLNGVWAPDGAVTVPEPLPWPGHDDADHLLVGNASLADTRLAGALVRQGDYLVGVTVRTHPSTGRVSSLQETVDIAAEIAQKTAENLAFLDPANGTDP